MYQRIKSLHCSNLIVIIVRKLDCYNLIVHKSIRISFNLFSAIIFAIYLALSMPPETAAARNFSKFWNYSLVFPDPTVTSVSSVTLVMPTRAECVSLCGMNATCCCTQWVPSNNTCTILMADRAGLSPNPLAVSAIDSTVTLCGNY